MLSLLTQPIRTRSSPTGVPQVYDPVRRRWFILTPEEHVRQRLLAYLLHVAGYPKGMMAVEKQTGQFGQRFDLVVYDRRHVPWLIAECKAPEVDISEATLAQVTRYHAAMPAAYWLLTNGLSTFCAKAPNARAVGDVATGNNEELPPPALLWLDALPAYEG